MYSYKHTTKPKSYLFNQLQNEYRNSFICRFCIGWKPNAKYLPHQFLI